VILIETPWCDELKDMKTGKGSFRQFRRHRCIPVFQK
jgi:hypothetical protein